MPEVVVVHVIPVDDLDAPQILGVEDSLEAGGDYAHWKPLLRPQGLAVLAVGDDAVVHRFGDGHARGALHFLGAFSDEPCRAAFQAALLEQRRSSTPVHSEQLVIPCDSCTVLWRAVCRFPAHSRKCNRLTDGKRFKSSMVKVSGRSTRPWIIKVCCLGSMSGRKAWRVVAI